MGNGAEPGAGALVTRRGVLAAGAAALASGMAGRSVYGQAAAEPPSDRVSAGQAGGVTSQDVGVYRFAVGDVECWSIADGTAKMPPRPMWAPEASDEELAEALRAEFLPVDELTLYFNVLLVRSGNELVLVDAGNGAPARPMLGRLVERLGRAGISPEQITGVLVSHMHGDHYGGLFAEGTPVFPNAQLHISAAEREFWERATPDDLKSALPADTKAGFIERARQTLATGKAWNVVKPGDEPVRALQIVEAAGHTPGHIAIRVGKGGPGGDSLLHVADLAHHHALMVPNPQWTALFDTDQRAAAATRRRIFAQAAAERTRVYGYHMPWPGVGHLRTQGNGYRWVAEPWAG